MSREVDVDLLADYLGGALDGTPDAGTVARLIAEDDGWARAYTDLTLAIDAARADLDVLARTPDPMPADVAARIDAMLARRDLTAADTTADASKSPARDAVSGPARPGEAPQLPAAPKWETEPGARVRRRWTRWAGSLAAAAGVVAFCGLGAVVLHPSVTDDGGMATSRERDANLAAPGASASTPPQPRLVASGVDYDRQTLAARADGLTRRAPAEAKGADTATIPDPALDAHIPPALRRLREPSALDDCLSAIGSAAVKTTRPTPPTSVEVVDYARFEGSPAVVVVLTDAAGARWMWAAGPDCGSPSSGADTIFNTRVG